ncbi:MAG TPA: FHA domain-containing protein [Polyangiaceae bacterium]|nr:FHA domain-containing protein [Polyangiaceae bacterium]
MAFEPERSPSGPPPTAATWRLRVDDPKGVLFVDQALERRRYTIGRGKHCDFCLPAREVSREHAALERDEAGRWWLVDLGSTSGTFVNGRRSGGRRALSTFDVAYVGEYRLELRAGAPAARPSIVLPRDPDREAPARVRVYEGRLAGRDLRLDRGRVVFGEGPDAALPLEGAAYEGVRVVIRPLKEGGYEVSDESARPSLTVDGRPTSACRLGANDALLGFGPLDRQRANALDAFSVRYLPAERSDDDATPAPASGAGEGGAGRAPDEEEPPSGGGLASDVPAAPARAPADAAAARWPDLDFGERPGAAGLARTVEVQRPAAPAAPAALAPLLPSEPARPPPARARAPRPAAQAPRHMGQTIVSGPPGQEPEVEAAPVSISTFVKPLEAMLTLPPDDAASGRTPAVEEAFGASALAEARVNRTLKLSEPAWPAQREALRARAEAVPRRWWLPGAALALLALAVAALLLGVRRRAPSPPVVAEGAAPVPARPPAPPAPSAAPTAAPEPASPPLASGEGAAPPPAPPRPGRAGRGAALEGAGPRGDNLDPERRRRLQELCKQRLDCAP